MIDQALQDKIKFSVQPRGIAEDINLVNQDIGNSYNILSRVQLQKQIETTKTNALTVEHQSILDKQIKNIMSPVKINLTKGIDNTFSEKQLQQLSIQKQLGQLYVQILAQLISHAYQINPITKKQMELNGIPLSQFIHELITRDQPIHQNLMELMKNLKKNTILWKKYMLVILAKVFTKVDKILETTKYCIDPTLLINILFNQKCTTFDESDQKTLTFIQTQILRKKLKKIADNQYLLNTNTLVKKIILKQLKHKSFEIPGQLKKTGTWSQVTQKELVNPKLQMVNRYHIQGNILKQYQELANTKFKSLFTK